MTDTVDFVQLCCKVHMFVLKVGRSLCSVALTLKTEFYDRTSGSGSKWKNRCLSFEVLVRWNLCSNKKRILGLLSRGEKKSLL